MDDQIQFELYSNLIQLEFELNFYSFSIYSNQTQTPELDSVSSKNPFNSIRHRFERERERESKSLTLSQNIKSRIEIIRLPV